MKKRKRLLIALVLATVISVLLFSAGLFSGLYANKIIAERQATDSAFLLENVEKLERELQAYQLQERFLDSLSEEQSCEFAETYFEQTIQGLNDFWRVLPDRLEEYERGRTLTPEYVALKERYTIASLRTWIIARQNHHVCGNNPIPLLYFYSSTCDTCLEQGEALDGTRDEYHENEERLVIFTIDTNVNVPAVQLVKEYYGVQTVPALIVGETIHQGTLLTTQEVIELVEEGRSS